MENGTGGCTKRKNLRTLVFVLSVGEDQSEHVNQVDGGGVR